MGQKSHNMKYFFEPRSIAVIGASENREKIGFKILDNITSGGYSGKVFPVNPKGGEILGLRVYKNVDEISEEIDMAVIAIPANLVFDSVVSCGNKKVKFVMIISSGFSEVGNVEEEKKIGEYAKSHDIRILGPNIFGLYSSPLSLNSTFGSKNVKKGNLAIITQSGALGISMMGKTLAENIGLSAMVSVGNRVDIDEVDLLEYLIYHDETKIIMIYLEGVHNGEKLRHILKEVTKKKPVIVIKSGRSKKGAIAAASHTGSLAGSDEVFDEVMRQSGVLRAESLQDAIDWCKFFSNETMPQGENTLIITNGGGLGVLATDACEKYNVRLYDNYENLKETFSKLIPAFGSVKNPIDITGQADEEQYRKILEAALTHKEIHSLILLYCQVAVCDIEKLSLIVQDYYKRFKEAKKPLVFCLVGDKKVEEAISLLKQNSIPAFGDPYETVESIGAMYFYYNQQKNKIDEIPEASIDYKRINEIIAKVKNDKRNSLLAYESVEIMNAIKIATPKTFIAHNPNEAVRFAQQIGYPVVMKVVSRDILHKTDAGGVILNIKNDAEVSNAYTKILSNCKAFKSNVNIEAIEVAETIITSKENVETIIGARKDNAFGPIMMFGLGGIFVEVLKDVRFRGAPLSKQDAISMIEEIKSYPLLTGLRGQKRKDIDSIVDAIMKLSTLITKIDTIADIEINPLVVHEEGKGVKALDVRIILRE